METFKINKNLEIVCEWKKTRNAFKHTAILVKNGRKIDNTNICYENRTWEKFTFESVIKKLLDKTNILTDRQKKNFLEKIGSISKKETNAQFGTIDTMAKLGEIFHAGDKKATNDWKAKMLEAGLGNQGLIMPEDWKQLSEKEKERRLNGVIGELKK